MIAVVALVSLATKALLVGYFILPQPIGTLPAPILSTFAVTCLLGAALALTPAVARALLAIVFNALCTGILIADLWYSRFFGEALSFVQIDQLTQLLVVSSSVAEVAHATDAWLAADVVALTVWLRWSNVQPIRSRSKQGFVAGIQALCAVVMVAALPGVKPQLADVFEYEYSFGEVAGTLGLTGYHVFDAAIALSDTVRGWFLVSDGEIDELHAWFESRRSDRMGSPLAGRAQGRNLILLSAESLPAFAIGLSIDGLPVAPHFTAFAAESLQFVNYYDQTHRGATSDAEFMALNSLLPLHRGAVATRFEGNAFRALPTVLREHGYTTFSSAGEPPSFWNMHQIHRRYGFASSMFLPEFQLTEWIGAGLADDAFLRQAGAVVRGLKEPFFAFLLTSSNHHPWMIPEARRILKPEPLAGTTAGAYLQSIRFADEAFGAFIDDLRKPQLLERSLVVVYGDHRAGFDEGTRRQLLAAAGYTRPASPLDAWQFERRMPLMIRLPNGEAAGPRDVPGGHLDIAPTIASLLGIQDPRAPWLGQDLTAPARRLIIFRDGHVTNGQATALSTGSELSCWAEDGTQDVCGELATLVEEGRALFKMSDRIIANNLVGQIADRIQSARAPVQRASPPVLAIAHRGDSKNYPENTAAAIVGGFDAGADLVEVDVRLSRDRIPIVFHDDTLERTSNGKGRPESLRLSEFKMLDVGSWKDPKFRGLPPLSLADALTTARGRGRLYLDVKAEGLAQPIAVVLRELGIGADRVLIGAWTDREVAEFRRHLPAVPIVLAMDAPIQWTPSLFGALTRRGVWGVELGDTWPAAFIGDAVTQGVPVFAYTANDAATMRQLVEKGVVGIESDDPGLLVSVLSSLGRR
jgi:phosphoglycerol transferase MdoB-like AlkP superfamily enzyme/glycerophosphoryl diester phosphodiesterase